MKRLTLALIATITLVASAAEFTLRDFTVGGYTPRSIGAVRPAADGKHFYRLTRHASTIERCSYQTGKTVETVIDSATMVAAGVGTWDGYRFADNNRTILLWTESEPIYRHSFRAKYFVYDRDTKRLQPVTDRADTEIATLSPDGKRVAYVVGNNVFIKQLADDRQSQVTRDGEKNKIINAVPDWVYQEEFGILNSFCWSPDGSRLAFIRFDETEVPMSSMAMYEGDCNPNSDYAYRPGSFDFKYPVAGERNSLVSVIVCDVATGELHTVPLRLKDDDYVPHIAFPRNDALMVMTLNRTQNDLHIFKVNPADYVPADIYHETSSTWIDIEMSREVSFSDNSFVIVSEKSGYAQLYQYDLDGRLIAQLTSGDQPVTAYYGYSPKAQRHFYQCTDGPLNRVVRAVDNKGKTTDIAAGKGTNSAAFSSDFSYYIHTFSNATTPTQYRVVSTDRNRPVRDLQLNEAYAEKYNSGKVPLKEFFTFDNDGVTLNGYLIKPLDFDPTKKYPVILSQYSGPGSQQVKNNWKIDWENYFAMQGYVICCVDGRGTGARGKAFESVTYLNLGHYETIDQIAAAKHMANQPWADPERIGIWGWSYGGYEVLMALSHPDSPFAAGVAIAPVTSWRLYDTIYAERFMRTPGENPDGYSNSAPLNHVDDMKAKLLIMFGSADDNVHIINSMQYIAKLHSQKSQFEMMIYPNMNHSINGCGVRETLYQRVLNFFDRNLK